MKNLMKKPAAARKKKKRSACMKMRTVMKKEVGRQKIIKRPAMVVRVRVTRWRKKKKEKMVKMQVKNARARARKAARNKLPYRPKSPKLVDVAAAAYAAKVEAYSARQAADEAKKDAADARAIGIENRKRIIVLEGEVIAGKKALNETAARANRNEARLNTDDRKRG